MINDPSEIWWTSDDPGASKKIQQLAKLFPCIDQAMGELANVSANQQGDLVEMARSIYQFESGDLPPPDNSRLSVEFDFYTDKNTGALVPSNVTLQLDYAISYRYFDVGVDRATCNVKGAIADLSNQLRQTKAKDDAILRAISGQK
jgi:hypothetical protein